ncbi:MAG: extradiol ring-cleavage dioxygenase [Candidatus Rokubacteria bacterium]|nr:extradiol ring-cleavage dioxygenase [Candidatus Rokubacteria bacterium]
MLNATVDDWPRFVERDRARAHLDRDGRPVTFDELLRIADPGVERYLTPESFAARHAQAQAGVARLADTLKRAALDALIVVGDDQKELFHEDNLPSLLIYRGRTIRNVLRLASGPEWAQRASARYYEVPLRDYPVDAALASALVEGLIDREFDVAAAESLPDGQGEGHAFGFVHKRLMDGHVVPIVPVFLNTYYPPNQPTPRRCYHLGQAIREIVESYAGDARVGVLASGGLSHFTLDEDLDRAVIRALSQKDAAALQSLPRNKLNGGSSEIRNWICLAGAAERLTLDWVDYVPGYRTRAGTGTGLCFATWSPAA